jgi:hypothetical protein
MRSMLKSVSTFLFAFSFSLIVVVAVAYVQAVAVPVTMECTKVNEQETAAIAAPTSYCAGQDDCDNANGEYCTSVNQGGTLWICDCK